MIIDCKQLSKNDGSKKVLDQITFQVHTPSITGVIGRNGAGKTTLLKILAGFWKKTSGHVEVFHCDPFDHLTVSANTIFVDDQMGFPETLTLDELLQEGSRFYPRWDGELAKRLCDYFQFEQGAFHHQLSKGKKSTFNLIFGLCARTPITILDEPTTGMDQAVRKDMYRAILKDYIAYPRTMLISSHHVEEIENILEDMILIDEGKLLLHASIDDVREYAIGVTGNRTRIENWMCNKEIVYKEATGIDDMYVVVRNKYDHQEIEQLGFTISNISASDLAVYVTNKKRGGIDDVFQP